MFNLTFNIYHIKLLYKVAIKNKYGIYKMIPYAKKKFIYNNSFYFVFIQNFVVRTLIFLLLFFSFFFLSLILSFFKFLFSFLFFLVHEVFKLRHCWWELIIPLAPK